MANIFPRWSNLLPLKIAVCAGSAAAGVALAFTYYATPKTLAVGYQPAQPIPFSHKIHVDQIGLDCRYCHSFVDVSGHSNVPTGSTCWNCHQHVQRESPKLAPLHKSMDPAYPGYDGKPIEWVRIHKAPDFVYFNHAAHVNRGVSCQSCHGNVNRWKSSRRTSRTRWAGASIATASRRISSARSKKFTISTMTPTAYISNNPAARRENDRRNSASSSRSSSRCIPRRVAPPATIDPRPFFHFPISRSPNMSKRIWQHPEVPAGETTVAWRSAGQLEDTPAFREWLDREFPQGAAEMADEGDMETSRRSFLKLMGASTALAGFGMAACRRPESYIVPYTKAPEWVIPGKATYYASSMPRANGATPLVVTTFEGRPTKLAPNRLHPDAGGTDAFAQASVLDLYSPSRSRKILNSGKPAKRADLDAAIAALAADKSSKIGFLFGADDSPTRARLIKELAAKFAYANFYQYEALSGEAPRPSATA